jgi:signal transduction histidine kinase
VPYLLGMWNIRFGTGRYLLEASSALPLLWRRRHPLPVACLTGTITLIITATVHPAQPFPYAVLVANYTIGSELGGLIRRVMIVVFLTGDVVAEFLHGQQSRADDYFITFLTSITAMMLGVLTQTQRAYAQAHEDRAAALERDREGEIARAAAAERARIARDMHDVVGHAVALMVVQAEAGPLYLHSEPAKAEAAFDAISATGRDAMSQLRRLLGVLKPEDEAGAAEAAKRAPQPTLAMLDELVEHVRAGGLAVALTSAGTPIPLPADAETAAYRVVQEALTNTLKHADASCSDVHLEWSGNALRVTVADDGRGCARDTARGERGPSTGHGLVGLRERLAAVGGTLGFPAPRTGSSGFTLTAVIPAPLESRTPEDAAPLR